MTDGLVELGKLEKIRDAYIAAKYRRGYSRQQYTDSDAEISMTKPEESKLDKIVADARRASEEREQSYRGQALKMYPHICGRCCREFAGKNLVELTVHHRDHNHDNNPADGSNWELLCMYCHDNEHQRQHEAQHSWTERDNSTAATHSPFAGLKSLLEKDE